MIASQNFAAALRAAEDQRPVTPKPVAKPQVPHPEDFAAWCAHPVTEFVATVWMHAAQAQMEAWIRASWDAGAADPAKLIELRTRADAYSAFTETGLEQYATLLET